jgi:hypothetical protein
MDQEFFWTYFALVTISGLYGCSGWTLPVSLTPPVLGARSSPNVVKLSSAMAVTSGLPDSGSAIRPLPSARLAQCARTKPQFELLLIHADGPGNAGDAIGRDLSLPDPEVHRIHGYPESIGNFADLCISRHHRHDLVFSSEHVLFS